MASVIVAKLQKLLGISDDRLPKLIGHVFLQCKEDQVSSEIPQIINIIIKPLADFAKKNDQSRIEVVFGLFCHRQILRLQAELAGLDNFDKADHVKCIVYLLNKNLTIRDGIAKDDAEDGRMTKDMIRNQIQQNKKQTPPPQAPPPPQASSSSNPPPAPYQRDSNSFIVAIPK
jgi:hypothetical protein